MTINSQYYQLYRSSIISFNISHKICNRNARKFSTIGNNQTIHPKKKKKIGIKEKKARERKRKREKKKKKERKEKGKWNYKKARFCHIIGQPQNRHDFFFFSLSMWCTDAASSFAFFDTIFFIITIHSLLKSSCSVNWSSRTYGIHLQIGYCDL